MREHVAANPSPATPGRAARLAFVLFILAIVSFFAAPAVLAGGPLDDGRRALGALLLFGVPMVLLLAVVALAGKPAYAFIKQRVLRRDGAPAEVGATRYLVGLLLVVGAVLLSWLETYLYGWLPVLEERRFLVGALADATVLAGLAVLGGAFWDKVHALFVQEARVVHPSSDGPVVATAELVEIGWRFWAGVGLLGCMVLALCMIPLASSIGWDTAKVAKLTGIILIANKVLLFAAIAVMGKSGYNHLKGIVGGFLGKFAPARQVSPGRYALGLVLFLVPLFMTWIQPYITAFLRPGSVYGFLQELALEVLILVGLFMLGGEFWDKVKSLFSSRSRVEFPGRA